MAFLVSTPLPASRGYPLPKHTVYRRHTCRSSTPSRPQLAYAVGTTSFPPAQPPPSNPEEARRLITSTDYIERLRGAVRIKSLPENERLEGLLALSKDSHAQVRYTAVSSLASFDGAVLTDDERQTLLERMKELMNNDGELSVRAAAADVIAGLGLKEGFNDLVEVYNKSKDWMLKFSIVASMGGMGEKGFTFLKELIVGEGEIDALILTGALGALGDLGDPRGLELVEVYLDSSDSSVKERAKISYDILKAKVGEQ